MPKTLFMVGGISRVPMVDKPSVFKRMTVWTNKNEIVERIILSITVLVMESKNFRMFAVSAQRTFVDRPSAFLKGATETIGMNAKSPRSHSTFSTAKTSVICLALGTWKVFSAIFAGFQLGRPKSNISHLRSALSRAVCLRLTTFPDSGKLYSAKEAQSEVLGLYGAPLTVAFSGAKTSIDSSCRMHVKLAATVLADHISSVSYLVFTTFRSAHALIINQNLERCNHG